MAEVLAFLLFAGRLLPGTSAADAAREGWLLFYLFHHVGIEVLSPNFYLPGGAETAWPPALKTSGYISSSAMISP